MLICLLSVKSRNENCEIISNMNHEIMVVLSFIVRTRDTSRLKAPTKKNEFVM